MAAWGILPASVGIVLAIGVIVSYVIAVLQGHVDAFFPYISDTGVKLPERSIFSEFVNLASILAFATIVLRFKLITELTAMEDARLIIMSKVAVFLGALSCLGLSLVANFQEKGMEIVHLIGAALVFVLGCLYALLDASISYRMCPQFNGLAICRVRLVVALCSTAFLFGAIIAGAVSLESWTVAEIVDHDRQHWKPDDPGYTAHLVSTFCEWGLAISFGAYFFTHIRDFHKFELDLNMRFLVRHLSMDPPSPAVTTRVRSTLAEQDERSPLLT